MEQIPVFKIVEGQQPRAMTLPKKLWEEICAGKNPDKSVKWELRKPVLPVVAQFELTAQPESESINDVFSDAPVMDETANSKSKRRR